MIKSCTPFTYYISKIKNIKIDNAKDIDTGMPMYNLIEYGNNYYKTPEIYDNTTGINYFQLMVLLLIFLLKIIVIITIIIIIIIIKRIIIASIQFKTKIVSRIEEDANTKNFKIRVP